MLKLQIDMLSHYIKMLPIKAKLSGFFLIPHTFFYILLPSYTTGLYIICMIAILSCCFAEMFEKNNPLSTGIIINVIMGTIPAVIFVFQPNFAIFGYSATFFTMTFMSIFENRALVLAFHGLSSFLAWVLALVNVFYNPLQYLDTQVGFLMQSDNFFWQFGMASINTYIIFGYSVYERSKVSRKRESRLQDLNKCLEAANKELKGALEEKDNFILRFSHEIRNPLNSLLGNIELLSEYMQEGKSVEMLSDAKVCGEILLQLINNVLDTAKVSSGQLDISIQTYNIRDFFEKLWVITSEIIRKKNLYGTLSLNIEVPEFLDFDKHRLMQIMINLISNATKFTDQGYVEVYVDFLPQEEVTPADVMPKYFTSHDYNNKTSENSSLANFYNLWDLEERKDICHQILTITTKKFPFVAFTRKLRRNLTSELEIVYDKKRACSAPQLTNERKVDSKGFIRIEVIDSGCGMSMEQLSSLFQKFSQVNGETSKRQIGTGLGLWITKELVELMHGEIKVYSAPGVGTCFVLTLESFSRNDQSIINSGLIPLKSLKSHRKRCLIVDDSPYNQDITKRFLEKCMIEKNIVANNGLEAVELFKANKEGYFHYIYMNLEMPIMDGRTACKLIRQHEESLNWNPTKIVIITSYSTVALKKELTDPEGPYKANYFILKPINYETIQNSIDELDAGSPRISQDSRRNLIMVVDDDPFNLSMMERFIGALGFKCVIARNGVLAIETFKENEENIGLIFMDCEMPIMGGFEACEEIIKLRKEKGLKSKLPIIGLTGHAGQSYKVKAEECGMKGLLVKPITIAQLKELLVQESF